MIILLDNTPNEPTKCRTKIWLEINDDARGTYNTNIQIKFCDAYILVKGTITVAIVVPPPAEPNNNDKGVVFKNCARFTDCISEINNTQIDNVNALM